MFKGRVLDVGADSVILELVGTPEKIEDFLVVLQPYKVQELARSGLVSMERGRKSG